MTYNVFGGTLSLTQSINLRTMVCNPISMTDSYQLTLAILWTSVFYAHLV